MWTWETSTPPYTAALRAELAAGWDTREDAESWLQDVFDDLLSNDVHEVTLALDGTEVYSMSLDTDDAA